MLRSALLHRLPRLAGRRAAAAVGTAGAPPVVAGGEASSAAFEPGQAEQQKYLWQHNQQHSRWYSALAQPGSTEGSSEPAEASSGDGKAGARSSGEQQERAAGGGTQRGTRVFVNNLSWDTHDQALMDHFSQVGAVRSARILKKGSGPGSMSIGCALVDYETAEGAGAAIEQLGSSSLDGRQIYVREDREGENPNTNRNRGGRFDDRSGRFEDRGGRNGDSAGRYQDRGGRYGDREGSTQQWQRPQQRQRQFDAPSDRSAPADGGEPSTRVVVHGLPWTFEWMDLKDMAKQALATGGGNTESVMRADIRTRPDGTSRGWGLVIFATPEEAAIAIQGLHGTNLEGRVVSAKFDMFSQQPRGEAGFGREGYRAPGEHGDRGRGSDMQGRGPRQFAPPEPASRVMLTDLPEGMSWQDLKDLGRQALAGSEGEGGMLQANVTTNPDGTSFGVLSFSSAADAQAAVKRLDGAALVDGEVRKQIVAKIEGVQEQQAEQHSD